MKSNSARPETPVNERAYERLTSRGLFAFCWPFWIGCAIGQMLLLPLGLASLDMFLGMCAGCMCPYLSRKFSSANDKSPDAGATE